MNIVSNHNRLLRGAAIPTAGGDVYNSGWEYTPEGEISGYSGSAIYTGECECDSAAVVDSAFNKSTAWVEEQNYLTAHQDVSNLPYVQNSSLEFNGALISGISGSGFYAVSADNANYADLANSASESEHAISATVSQEAVHAGSADFATSANSSLNAEIATVSYVSLTALSADFVVSGWEHDESGNITAYNNSAFVGNGGQYEGISPIVVNNEEMKISAKSALLGVQDPLYFVEDSQTATVIGIHDSAFPTFEGTEDGKISAINGSAINAASVVDYSGGSNISIVDHVISVTGSVPSADIALTALYANSSNSATYDSLGRKIVDTYLTAHQDWTNTIQNASGNAYNSAVNWVVDQHYLTAVTGDNTPYSAGANIDITDHVVSGKDWTDEITAAANSAYTAATAQIPDVTNLPYVQNTALESNGILISGISGSGLYATSAENAFEADHAYEADYVLSGWEYDEDDNITGYDGSAFAGQGGTGIEYEGVLPIVVNNVEHKISAQSARLGVQEPLYFVEDSNSATVIGISGLPEVEGLMYESGLGLTGGYITGYNGSGFSADRAGYAVSATSANGAVSSQSATVVTGGWETADGKITGYNGTAFSAAGGSNPQVPVIGTGSVTISKPSTAVVISGKDYSNDITAASSYVYSLVSGNSFPASADDACKTLTAYSGYWNSVYTTVNTYSSTWTGGGGGSGPYIPYTSYDVSTAGMVTYKLNSGISVNSNSGLVEIVAENNAYNNEAHLHLMQNKSGDKAFWSELDGAGETFFMFWNSANINTGDGASYTSSTTAKLQLQNGMIYYSATNGNEWYMNTTNYNNWQSAYSFVNNWSVKTQVVGSTGDATGSNILYIVTGS